MQPITKLLDMTVCNLNETQALTFPPIFIMLFCLPVKPSIQVWHPPSDVWREDVTIAGLRIGQTRLTHGCVLRGEAGAIC